MGSILAGREMSAFSLSIATSLAFESIFKGRQEPYDSSRVIPEHIDINNYEYMYINVHTLFRNMTSSIESKSIDLIRPDEYASYIREEMEVIKSILMNEGSNVCKPIFYTTTFKKIINRVKNKAVYLRVDSTDRQKVYTSILNKTMELLTKGNNEIEQFDSDITPKGNPKALILTHYALDLLSYTHFNKLHLIESNTGVLKERHLFYTKYSNHKDLPPLPFLRKLIPIFGDNNTFKPSLKGVRDMVLEVAKKCKWTNYTTEPKILQDIDLNIKEQYIAQMIHDF